MTKYGKGTTSYFIIHFCSIAVSLKDITTFFLTNTNHPACHFCYDYSTTPTQAIIPPTVISLCYLALFSNKPPVKF